MAVLYFLFVAILPGLVVPSPVSTPKVLLERTISTVEKALTFFSSDYSSINVDGLFGLRLGQGQLMKAAEICSKSESCDQYLPKLKSLTSRLDDTCQKALPYVEQSDPDYYKRFEETISKPYLLPYTPTKFDAKLMDSVRIGNNSSYSEEKGDACYSRMMGTFKENGKHIAKCNITNNCFNMMTSPGTSRYAITHQLLYFMVIEHVDCTEQVKQYLHGRNLFDIQKSFCQRILKETESLVENGKVKSSHKDLFFEQSVLCGSLGFEDFFKSNWISMTLTWPDKKDGCMKMTMPEMLETGASDLFNEFMTDPKAHKLAGDLGKDLVSGFEKELQKLSGSKTMRKLLREKAMKDDCMAHASGLAFGTFGSYVHYLVQQM